MFTVEEILKATNGVLLQGVKSAPIRNISTDSRIIRNGELFVAIQGENFDGHEYLRQVARKGACAVIVSRKRMDFPSQLSVIFVPDTIKAYGQIARFYRDRFPVPVIAITGSAGKTTTKEMMATVLSKRYQVLKNFATHNNHIGVPATLLALKPSHQIVVIELGTNRCGDIRWLTKIARPTVAIFTNIGESHLEFLKSQQGVFEEKFELVKNMETPGTVIYNADNPFLRNIPKRNRHHRLISYGLGTACDYRASDIEVTKNGICRFKVNGHDFTLKTPMDHNIYNALASICCGRLFKIEYHKIKNGLGKIPLPEGRAIIKKIGPWNVIDDTYNANPVSVRSVLHSLGRWNGSGRKILVCGDMLELGSQSERLHRLMGKLAAKSQMDMILTVGRLSRWIVKGAQQENKSLLGFHHPSIEAMNDRLIRYCRPGDTILVKGSRAMHMEKTIQFLRERAQR